MGHAWLNLTYDYWQDQPGNVIVRYSVDPAHCSTVTDAGLDLHLAESPSTWITFARPDSSS